MKTIKQLADELGVSKDKIHYQVRKLPCNYYVKRGNITYLTDDGALEIKRLLLRKNVEESHASLPDSERLFYQSQIAELTKLLNQEQQLHMATSQKLLMITESTANETSPSPQEKSKIDDEVATELLGEAEIPRLGAHVKLSPPTPKEVVVKRLQNEKKLENELQTVKNMNFWEWLKWKKKQKQR